MASFNVQLNSRAGGDGRHLLMVRITQNRKHKYRSLERYVRNMDFNRKAKFGSWIRTTNPDHKVLNEYIKGKLREFEALTPDELVKQPRGLGTSPAIRTEVGSQPNERACVSFSAFVRTEIARHRSKGEFRISVKKNYLINKVLEATGREIMLDDVTVTFLKDYEKYWSDKGNKVNTRHTDMKSLRAIVNSAIAEGLLPAEYNPFRQFKLRTERTVRTKLTAEEVVKIEELTLSKGTNIWHARNMFLFSFYCAGVRFGDLVQMKWRNIQGTRLTYVMDKNGDPHQVLIGAKALQILGLYRTTNTNTEPGDYIFPFLNARYDYSDYDFLTRQISSKNTIVNSCLKDIASAAGIDKSVSFHISRHTFAYLAIRKTGDLYGVSKSLNHKRIDTTMIYLKDHDPEATDSIMRKLFEDDKSPAKEDAQTK